jgi:ABC-type sugar transport systems, permease components
MQSTFSKKSVILIFILPAFILYTFLVVISIIWAGYYSFFNWSGIGKMTYVGIENYVELLLNDKVFWPIVGHTLIYTVICIVLQVFGGLLFAIFLTRITKFRATLQTLYYIPVVISSVALCQIFTKLFSVTPTGVVNAILSSFNKDWQYLEWISSPDKALYVAAFTEGYKYLGLYMVIFYAALIGVPSELTEASIVDGANVFRQYWHVKLPYIKPVILANCVLVLNGSLRSFDISYLLTKGGPGNASELLSTYMYKQAFSSMKYGYGSAVAVMIVLICLGVGFLFRRMTERGSDEL